jgi:hypothetical protein
MKTYRVTIPKAELKALEKIAKNKRDGGFLRLATLTHVDFETDSITYELSQDNAIKFRNRASKGNKFLLSTPWRPVPKAIEKALVSLWHEIERDGRSDGILRT